MCSLDHTDRPLSSSWLARAAQELLAVTGPTGVDPGFSERVGGGGANGKCVAHMAVAVGKVLLKLLPCALNVCG